MGMFHETREDFLRWAKGKPDWAGSRPESKEWAWRAWQACFGKSAVLSRLEAREAESSEGYTVEP